MGTKYLPTNKDLKATQRFQQRQNPRPKFKTALGSTAAVKQPKKPKA